MPDLEPLREDGPDRPAPSGERSVHVLALASLRALRSRPTRLVGERGDAGPPPGRP